MPRIQLELIEQDEDLAESSTESFDRIAFAEQAIALVRPPRMRVAILQGTRRVKVSSGRQWGGGPGAKWAMVSVPKDASRRAIARAVLALHDETSTRPWALDVLVAGAEG
ncbi:MAG: hypothetical protein KIT84_38255 [Labilithrix sp.]|nr:hypothetical protein [Labilithrix sp.]MCW5816903.1 hypothetical protein [Labilithrix sp.]